MSGIWRDSNLEQLFEAVAGRQQGPQELDLV